MRPAQAASAKRSRTHAPASAEETIGPVAYSWRVVRLLLATAAVLLVLAPVAGLISAETTASDVDRHTYVRANLAILAELPTLPGSSPHRVASESWRVGNGPLLSSYVGGYITTATYQAAPQTTIGEVMGFLVGALRAWRLRSWGGSNGWSEAFGAKETAPHRCYARGGQSVCFDLGGFRANGRYEISVDNRGHEPRAHW